MSRVPLSVPVAQRDQHELHKLLGSGMQPVRVVLRALALLHLADGTTAPATAAALKELTPKGVRAIAHRYLEGGLERALYEKQRPGATPVLEPGDRQRIIAMVCWGPPEGQARWTVRLIAQEAVKRKLAARGTGDDPRIAPKPRSEAGAEKNVVRPSAGRRVRREDGGRARHL